jgi:hypothetical protein
MPKLETRETFIDSNWDIVYEKRTGPTPAASAAAGWISGKLKNIHISLLFVACTSIHVPLARDAWV